MDKLLSAMAGGIVFVCVAIGAFMFGKSHCPTCNEVERVQLLAGSIAPAQKIVLVESGDVLRYDWKLVSTWPRLARLLSKLGANERGSGHLQYDTKFSIGYDLRDRSAWSLRQVGDKLIFDAPPMQLVGCPAVLTHTMKYVVSEKALLVDEKGREPEIVAVASAQALAAAHDKLRDKRGDMEAIADQELKKFILGLAASLGVNATQLEIHLPRKPAKVPPAWVSKTGPGGVLDVETLRLLKDAGCSSAA